MRPVPKLRLHPLGHAYVRFRVNGKRRSVYFGPFGSRSADVKYAAFVRMWPMPLWETPTEPGKWPAARLIEHDGQTRRLSEWAALAGLKPSTLSWRLAAGWPMEKALGSPSRNSG